MIGLLVFSKKTNLILLYLWTRNQHDMNPLILNAPDLTGTEALKAYSIWGIAYAA